MATIEGRGKVIPKAIIVTFEEKEMIVIRAIARDISDKKGYQFINSFLGLSGEAALAKYLEKQLKIQHLCNGNLLDNGDGSIDIQVGNIGIQIKTHSPGKPCRILRIANGKLITQLAAIFVFCEADKTLLDLDRRVKLIGWINRQDLEQLAYRTNIEDKSFLQIDEKNLQTLPRLVTYLYGQLELRRLHHGPHSLSR